MNVLSNVRAPGESFVAYRARLRAVGKYIRQYLRGQFVHVSVEALQKGVTYKRATPEPPSRRDKRRARKS